MSAFTLPKYSPEELDALEIRMLELSDKIMLALQYISLKTSQGQEFYSSGVMWRLFLIRESYLYLTEKFPPKRNQALSDEETRKASLYLNSLYLHTWGCVDNWAWIIAYEISYKNLKNEHSGLVKGKGKINLFPSMESKENLRNWIHQNHSDFDKSLSAFDSWIETISKLRHPAAHRIPLKVHSYIINGGEGAAEWVSRVENSQKQIQQGIEKNSVAHITKALETMDSLGSLGQFFPIFSHENILNEKGEIVVESCNFLYPTIIDDCEKLLLLIEACTTFLLTREQK